MHVALFLLASAIVCFNSIHGQTTPASTTLFPTLEPIDASEGGKSGNPGASIRFAAAALDSIYKHAMDMVARALRSMIIPDIIVPIGGGMLTIRSTRITEAKFAAFERTMMPPNRIRSRITGGRLTSIGQWSYKPFGAARQLSSGLFRTIVYDAEVNVTKQLGRTWDAKPMIQTQDCKAYLGRFRVEIDGFGENTTVIDHCENLLCLRIRSYFEDAVCNMVRNYVKETINAKLATFPTRINLGADGNRFMLDYCLLSNEPKVTEEFIQSNLRGEVISRGTSSSTQFHANDLEALDNRKKMISFTVSDFTFNTLFHQAHGQQFRFSAQDMLPPNSPIKNLLKLDCPTAATETGRRSSSRAALAATRQCLGSAFENLTVNQFAADATGDLVFKSQRPVQVLVRQPPQKSQFGVDGGTLEAYGAAGPDGKRDLLGRAEVKSMRGEFVPRMSGCNISGSVNISDLKLNQLSPTPVPSRRALAAPIISKLGQLSIPVMTEMFNIFLDQFAQFPVPLVEGYACSSPEFRSMHRAMQIDCDVRVLPDATRAKPKY